MTLSEALQELEQAALALDEDAELDDGPLLDLAVLALALQCPDLWRETGIDPVAVPESSRSPSTAALLPTQDKIQQAVVLGSAGITALRAYQIGRLDLGKDAI